MSDQSQRVESDRQVLLDARQRGTWATLGAFVRLSGPGWLQSAMTLGGGSLASSLYLGVLAGFGMLWLQPFAMVLGIVMLSAIGYVTLSTGQRPFQAINEHVNPVLGWGWALASLVASMVWCLPQFSLATAVVEQNLLPRVLSSTGTLSDTATKALVAGSILAVTIAITWAYDRGAWGIRLYEGVLKLMVAVIVACFVGVVVRLSISSEGLPWREIAAGLVPDPGQFFRPAAAYEPLLAQITEPLRGYWRQVVVDEQRNVMISAAATAVGINMTFLMPYSLLARGWRKEFRGLLMFDLGTGMLIPFLLATSCVIIAAATQFHTIAPPGLVEQAVDAAGAEVQVPAKLREEFEKRLAARVRSTVGAEFDGWPADDQATAIAQVTQAERQLAATLASRDARDLAQSLAPLTGDLVANVIFGLGVLGMTLSTITLLMLISGFVICEMLGVPPTGWPHRLGALAAAVGVLGPFLPGRAAFYLAVPTSIFGMTLLPIAYFTFFLLMNQKSLLGDERPRGWRRVVWNVLMAIAASTALVASVWSIHAKGGWWGLSALGGFVLLALVVQVSRAGRRAAAV